MDPQELRSLQDAYSQVYQKLDEMQYTQPPQPLAQIKPAKKAPSGAERAAAIGIAAGTLGGMWAAEDKGKKKDKKKKGAPPVRPAFKEEADIYDILLSHLIDEGYAASSEAAEAIMANMSEEWMNIILEKEDSEYEKASDAALDAKYGYGRATGDKRSFGRAANRASAAAAIRAIRRGERSGSGTSTEAGSDAVHQGWAKTAKTSTDQTPEKKAKRAELANTSYSDLPDDEKEKDRVSFNAVKAVYNRNKSKG